MLLQRNWAFGANNDRAHNLQRLWLPDWLSGTR